MNRVKDYVMPFLIVLVAISATAFGLLALANLFFPGLSAQAGLSLDTIGGAITSQVSALTTITGLSPLTDVILFVAAYVFVCMILWIQSELRIYLTNRSHFK